MTKEVEKDSEPYYLDSSFIHISQDTGIELSKGYAIDYLIELARNNSYHPVRSYLDSIKSLCTTSNLDDTLKIVHDLFTEITGVKDKLQLTFLTKTLLAALSRVYKPGCFQRTVCILQGKQTVGKSSFWRELAGENFFNNSYKGTNETKDLMALHSAWINELAEFEKVYRKSDVATLKDIISTPCDKVVLPYGRSTSILKRMSIIVATTNTQDILKDPTGSTRFWVVKIQQKIDFKTLLANRDLIWGCIYKLHEFGYSYELSESEQQESDVNNENYSDINPLIADVENACRISYFSEDLREFITINEIWSKLHPDEDGKTLKPNEYRPIADVLVSLGYTNKKKKVNGKTVSGWELENKKLDDSGVTAVTESESLTPQGLLHSYPTVTTPQGTVTSESEQLPQLDDGNQCSNPTVTVVPQGFETTVTTVTTKNENSSENQKTFEHQISYYADYGGELVFIVGGGNGKFQVEYAPLPGQKNGRMQERIAKAHLKAPNENTKGTRWNTTPKAKN